MTPRRENVPRGEAGATDGAARQRPPLGGPGTPAQGRELRTRGRRTMRRLLDAAVKVFASRGYHGARVDDIVRRAGTSHGTFYLYFANKEDLFRVLTVDVAEQMSELVHSLGELEPGPRGRAALRSWLGDFAELYEHYGPVIRAWTEAETDTSEFGRMGNRMFGELTVAFARRIESSCARDLDPEIASLALLAMIERFHYYAAAGRLRVEREATLDMLASVLHDSLFGASARPAGRRRSAAMTGRET